MLRAFAATLVLTAVASAQTAFTTFDSNSNNGAWTFGADSFVDKHVGTVTNWYLHAPTLDTFAPEVHTVGRNSFWFGDWRAKGFSSVGVDLITFSTQFPFERPLSLKLSNGAQTVYYVGSELVPQVSEGWKSFEFSVPTASTTMPPGWAVLGGGAPDATWNAVVTNVTEVGFFYGDPTFFFIFDMWHVGADNMRASPVPPFTDVGHSLAGSLGVPVLSGDGQLLPNTEMHLQLENVPLIPSTFWLVIGNTALEAPFKGGVMVPQPSYITLTGQAPGLWFAYFWWPVGVPSGTNVYAQVWIPDAAGPKGFAATNGLKLTAP